jgi:hypothetical protein
MYFLGLNLGNQLISLIPFCMAQMVAASGTCDRDYYGIAVCRAGLKNVRQLGTKFA